MPRASAKFSEADVKRAVKGALAGGLKIAAVRIDEKTGTINIVSTSADQIPIDADDIELESFRRQNGYA